MELFGHHVGLAFQVADDCMDGEGYAAVLGRAKAKALAAHLIQKALQELRPFGERAAALRVLATYVINRIP